MLLTQLATLGLAATALSQNCREQLVETYVSLGRSPVVWGDMNVWPEHGYGTAMLETLLKAMLG